mgnify:CR=1 FL=1
MRQYFEDREEAGRELAGKLAHYRGTPDLLVLALPRGGVPVAAEVARRLGAELDVLVVRKVAQPFHPELALAAIATGGANLTLLEHTYAYSVLANNGKMIGEQTFEAERVSADGSRNYFEVNYIPDFQNGDYTIKWLEEWLAKQDEEASA